MIDDFRVLHIDEFPTHSVLSMDINVKEMQHSKRILQKPLSLYDMLKKACFPEEEATAEDEPMDKDKRERWKAYLNDFHTVLDAKLKASSNKMKQTLKEGTTTAFWRLWSAIFQEAGGHHASHTHDRTW